MCFILIPLVLIVSSAFPGAADTGTNEGQGAGQKVLFQEDFSESQLDMSRWKLTKDGDFNQMTMDVQRVEREGIVTNLEANVLKLTLYSGLNLSNASSKPITPY